MKIASKAISVQFDNMCHVRKWKRG